MKRTEIPARQIEMLLRAKYRVPETILKDYRYACCDKAVQDASEIKANRLYTILALVLHEELGYGSKRVQRILTAYNNRYEAFYNNGCRWHDLMKECREKTGMIIRTGEEGDELWEYDEEEENAKTKL